jgi:hypothetical protein
MAPVRQTYNHLPNVAMVSFAAAGVSAPAVVVNDICTAGTVVRLARPDTATPSDDGSLTSSVLQKYTFSDVC